MRKSFLFSFLIFFFLSFQLSGQTWSSIKRLTWNSGGSSSPHVAIDSSDWIHMVWMDDTPGNFEIFYKRSTDSGATWSGPKRLTWIPGWSMIGSIATPPGNGIHVVWYEDFQGNIEVFYKRSTDSGATWLGLTRMTWNSGSSYGPSIAADAVNNIHMLWYDNTPGNNDIFYKRSSNSGAIWSAAKRLTWNSGNSIQSDLAVSGSRLHVVWADKTPGNYEIFYKSSTDGGANWSGLARLTWSSNSSTAPSIAADSGSGVHVVWHEEIQGTEEILYKYSSDDGATWSGPKRLTWNDEDSIGPSIATYSDYVIHVVWQDNTPGNYEIFYRNSNDTGSSWSALTRLTWNDNNSSNPSIAADTGNGVHIVWEDCKFGAPEILYKNRK